jgi:hypothetical protein
MKNYKVYVTIKGYIEVEADSKEDAQDIVENGYSMNDVVWGDDEIDEIVEE